MEFLISRMKSLNSVSYSFCLQENPLENLNTAFDVAANHLDIPRMLVAEGWCIMC